MRFSILFLVILLSLFSYAKTIKTFYSDGELKSAITYKNGKKNGVEHLFYEDGATLKHAENYEHGRLHGLQQKYDRSSLLIQEENYRQGRLDGRSRYYRKGLLKREVSYTNGMVDGTYREFFPSGLTRVEILWRRDKAIEGYQYGEDGSRKALSASFLHHLKPDDIPHPLNK